MPGDGKGSGAPGAAGSTGGDASEADPTTRLPVFGGSLPGTEGDAPDAASGGGLEDSSHTDGDRLAGTAPAGIPPAVRDDPSGAGGSAGSPGAGAEAVTEGAGGATEVAAGAGAFAAAAAATRSSLRETVARAGQAARGAAQRPQVAPRNGRRVKLTVARIDPWSVMKLSFLLSVAAGIAFVVMSIALWLILSGTGFFDSIQSFLDTLQTNSPNPFILKDYAGFPRVVSLSVVLAVFDVLLMTAVATVSAFIYNVCSALVGGVQLTLTDD